MEKYGFFSSVDGDRLYTAADFTSYFGRFLTNGYFSVEPEGLKVVANGTLDLTVSTGSMWINGHIYELTEPKVLTVDTQANFSRKDRVVIKLDHINREIRAEIKKGEGSEYPVYPELQRDEDAYEMCIAQFEITKGSTAIQQAQVIDTRKDIELCGECTSLLDKRTLLDFCQVHGFTMDGTINSKDIMPVGEANIGAFNNRFNKIFCNELDVKNKLPYLSIEGGEVNGVIKVQDIIPLLDNAFRLGSLEKKFAEVNTKALYADTYNGYIDANGRVSHKFLGNGDFIVNSENVSLNKTNTKELSINGHKVFIQSDTPAGAKAGDVWLKV